MELLKIYQIIDSTNKEATRLLATGANLHGTAILSFSQTDGRGQYGRHWHAAPGMHLAMSIILQPADMSVAELPLLSMKVSLAMVRVLLELEGSIQPLIKWPNDIYTGSKKLAGILIENSLGSTRVRHSIIGIGMNVNETAFPDSIPNAISLFLLTKKKYDLEKLAAQVHIAVMTILDEPIEKWKPEYDSFIFGLGQLNSFEKNGEIISGKMSGVDSDGRIMLETGDGERKSYFAHEIKWRI